MSTFEAYAASAYFLIALASLLFGAYVGFSISSFHADRKRAKAQKARISFALGYANDEKSKRKRRRAQKKAERLARAEEKKAAKAAKAAERDGGYVPLEKTGAPPNAPDAPEEGEGLLGKRARRDSDSFVEFLCDGEGVDRAERIEELRGGQDVKYANMAGGGKGSE